MKKKFIILITVKIYFIASLKILFPKVTILSKESVNIAQTFSSRSNHNSLVNDMLALIRSISARTIIEPL